MREAYLLNQELALMAETQPYVSEELIVRGFEQLAEQEKTDESRDLAKDARRQFNFRMSQPVNGYGVNILKKCPGISEDECRGFIDRETGSCSICGTMVCKDCHITIPPQDELVAYDCEQCGQEIFSCKVSDAFRSICYECETGVNMPCNGHVCKKDDIETAKMIENDSKPCPNCSVYIFFIDGCDQMWCTQCKTAFSWKTGRVEKGRIHNPHFYQYLRTLANGDEIEREENCYFEFERVEDVIQPNSVYLKRLLVTYNILVEALHNETEPEVPENRDLRLKYLMKELSKKQFAELVQRRDKKYLKDLECFQIYDTLVFASTDIFLDIIEMSKQKQCLLEDDDLEEFKDRIFKLVHLINTQLNYIKRKYKVRPKFIVPNCFTRNHKDAKTDDIFARNVKSVHFLFTPSWGVDYFNVLIFDSDEL